MNGDSIMKQQERVKGVIVTGATSMIGIAIIESCVRRNVPVLAVVRENTKRINRLPKSDLIDIAYCELNKLKELKIEYGKYDVFYHLAWEGTSKQDRENPIIQEKNIRYALDAVDMAKRCGCIKFVGAGSQAEYGRTDGIITPQTRVAPEISYGIAKYAAGQLTRKLCEQYGLVHIWARIFSVYGIYDNESTMINYAINTFLRGEQVEFSAATQMWDYLNEKDAGEFMYRLGEKVDKNGVYCIASGDKRTLKEYILEIRDTFFENANIKFAEEDDRSKYGIEPDVEDLFFVTDYKPEISFCDGIGMVIKNLI